MSAAPKDTYWLKSGVLALSQNLLNVVIGFGSFFLLVRVLDKPSFGVWTLFITSTTLLETIRNGLVQSTLIRFLASSAPAEHPKVISASFALSGILTVLCMVLNIAFAHYLAHIWQSPQLVAMFYMYNVTYVLSGIMSQFQFIQQANLQFKGVFISSITRQGVLFLFIVVSYIFAWSINLINLVYIQTLGVLLATAFSYWFARNHVSYAPVISFLLIKNMFNYGKYAFGTSVSSMISGSITQMMLGAYVSTSAAGAYNIAQRITNLIEIPTNAVANIVFPQSVKRSLEQGTSALKYLYEKSVGTVLAIIVPALAFLLVFPSFAINIIAGGNYAESIPILQVTVLSCLLVPYGRQFGVILNSMGRTRLTFTKVAIKTLCNIGLNFWIIQKYGVLGAAFAPFIANIIGFIIGQTILHKVLGVRFLNTLSYFVQFYPDLYKRVRSKLNF